MFISATFDEAHNFSLYIHQRESKIVLAREFVTEDTHLRFAGKSW